MSVQTNSFQMSSRGNIFCHFFHLFLIVEYANNFKIVIREGKRRIFEKYKNVVFESYGKEEDLMRSPTGFLNLHFSSKGTIEHIFLS